MTRRTDLTTRREEILNTAGELFRDRGYHATGMREIASRLDLKGSSLYSHISSKEELLWELVNQAADAFLAAARAVDPDLPPAGRLAALVAAHLRVIEGNLPFATVFFQDWAFLPPERKERVIARRDAYERFFEDAIAEGIRAGEFTAPDARLATLFVMSALNWTYQWLRPGGRLEHGALSAGYAQLVLNALGHAAPAPRPAAPQEVVS